MKHVEKFIRHLQSSIEKRKVWIRAEHEHLQEMREGAKYHYPEGFYDEDEAREEYVSIFKESKITLKELHKQQKTETEMLKWLENIRSCHEEMICAMYGNDTNLLDFSLEESQHD